MKNLLLSFFSLLFIVSCKNETEVEKAIAKINIDISVERFDQFFGNAEIADLPKLKQAYPFLFPKKYNDTFWIGKMKDTLQQELLRESNKKYKNFSSVEAEIESLFSHLKFYYPEFNPPRVITTTSTIDYRNKVIVTDTIAIIAIDNYLGKDHYFYEGIQKFIRSTFEEEQIVVDMADEYARHYIYQPQRKTLLDEMIYFGKQLYFKDVMLPSKTEAQRVGYSEAQLDWAKTNEAYIWRYFIERELLYSTDTKLPSRFINPAPFSKFYLEQIDAKSPGRIGQYMGWQIVKAYMKNNDVSLKDMLRTKPEDIFNNSKFKPRK
ncbi:protein involved in gliding motility GldB [Hyunsoonleella jejuensis]|uniref:Protein involved in gliding motility GldB n=1 Tax=Hyunsoonleella jejuensis TaxID=419940 RepID=A0A1H9L6U7_9FLAO|nr:gliding motility lipoprotein GldB [Hyunsoonleella jejuensis]SER07038.1 protein involved in gliding motility GldB [Hyunsoonleella jejuensis]